MTVTQASDAPVKPDKSSAANEFVEIVKTIVWALGIALVLRVLLFQPFTIPSASMEPALFEGDYIIVSKWSYGYSRHSIPFSPPLFDGRIAGAAPKRGDVVVFKLPRDDRTDYIKRVIGLPGDRVQVRDGALLINGQPVRRRSLTPDIERAAMARPCRCRASRRRCPRARPSSPMIASPTARATEPTPTSCPPATTS
jgi:signal peptidase I